MGGERREGVRGGRGGGEREVRGGREGRKGVKEGGEREERGR